MKNLIRTETREKGTNCHFDKYGDISIRPIKLPITKVILNNLTTDDTSCTYSATCNNCAGKDQCPNVGEHCYEEEKTYLILNTFRFDKNTNLYGTTVNLKEADYSHIIPKGYNEAGELHIYDSFRDLSCWISPKFLDNPKNYILIDITSLMRWAVYTQRLAMISAWDSIVPLYFPNDIEIKHKHNV